VGRDNTIIPLSSMGRTRKNLILSVRISNRELLEMITTHTAVLTRGEKKPRVVV
jgi:hypothetical protein